MTNNNNNNNFTWQKLLRKNFTHWQQLADFLQLSAIDRKQLLPHKKFPLNFPLRLAQKVEKGTLEDPILKQFLPTLQEKENNPLFIADPVGDNSARCSDKLLHKYDGRILLVTTSACAMHCRYCFRQNFEYAVKTEGFEKEITYISDDLTIQEVILSGGDPLSLSQRVLEPLLANIDAIPHINRIRFHTRFPIGIPERIDPPFLKMLENIRAQVWFVIHVNHPKELDDDVLEALKKVRQTGAIVANQAVLLSDVNNNIETLKELCLLLVDNGILPYYLHQLDKVEGASHFEVSEEEGKRLMTALSEKLPGYAVPKYVREEAGMPSKTVI